MKLLGTSGSFAWIAVLVLVSVANANQEPDQRKLDRERQIRAGWIGVTRHSANDFSMLPEMARRGMNTVFLAPEVETAQEAQDVFERWQPRTEALGLKLFPMVFLYNRGDYNDWPLEDRWFVAGDGSQYRHTPCPNDPVFWQRKITDPFVQIARWAKDKPNVPGILFDSEMYGADTSAFRGACFCPSCRKEIAEESGMDTEAMDLDDKNVLARYEELSTRLAERSLVQTRLQVQSLYPGCTLGGTVLDHWGRDGHVSPFYKAITLAWGTAQHPILILSEATYSPGYHAARARPDRPLVRGTGSYVKGRPSRFGLGDHPGYIDGWLKKWKQWQAHADFLGGLWVNRIPHENFAENLYHLARHTGGYWVYHMRLFGVAGPLPGEGAGAYWQAIESANDELDQWLKTGGNHVSALKVRPFTIPAPAVDLGRWQKIDLPLTSRTSGPPGTLFRSKGVLFYLPAAAGDQVKLTVMADSAHPTKVKTDALAIVLVDPDGNVVQRDKLTAEDLLAGTKQPDGKYIARKPVQFRAAQTGTYCLYLKAIRYAFTIGESSHAWLVSLHYPAGTPHTRLDRPKELYLKTVQGAPEARWSFSAAPSSTPFVVRVFDQADREVAREEIVGSAAAKTRGIATFTVPLPQNRAQVLRVVFETPGARDVNIYPRQGLELWIGPSADAPFPLD